jgi:hypothetical protein
LNVGAVENEPAFLLYRSALYDDQVGVDVGRAVKFFQEFGESEVCRPIYH